MRDIQRRRRYTTRGFYIIKHPLVLARKRDIPINKKLFRRILQCKSLEFYN